jgi:DNA (cytosine-5)-methyltransferase 1
LPTAVETLPTPTATPYGSNQSASSGAAVRPSLDALVPALVPTPVVGDSKGTRNATARRRAPKATTTTTSLTLTDVVWLMPTPRTTDANGGGSTVTAASTSEPQSASLLPTPTANLGSNGGSQHPVKRRRGGHQPSIADVTEHLGAGTPPPSTGGSA